MTLQIEGMARRVRAADRHGKRPTLLFAAIAGVSRALSERGRGRRIG